MLCPQTLEVYHRWDCKNKNTNVQNFLIDLSDILSVNSFDIVPFGRQMYIHIHFLHTVKHWYATYSGSEILLDRSQTEKTYTCTYIYIWSTVTLSQYQRKSNQTA